MRRVNDWIRFIVRYNLYAIFLAEYLITSLGTLTLNQLVTHNHATLVVLFLTNPTFCLLLSFDGSSQVTWGNVKSPLKRESKVLEIVNKYGRSKSMMSKSGNSNCMASDGRRKTRSRPSLTMQLDVSSVSSIRVARRLLEIAWLPTMSGRHSRISMQWNSSGEDSETSI